MSEATEEMHSDRPGAAKLWAGWLLPVAAWVLHLYFSYSFVEWVCHNREALEPVTVKILLHGLTGLCVLLALCGGALAWSSHRRLRLIQADCHSSRGWFMAASGVGLSSFLVIIILVQGLPNLVLAPCV